MDQDDEEVRWADLVFVSTMSVQKESVKEVIQRCKTAGVRIVAGKLPSFVSFVTLPCSAVAHRAQKYDTISDS